VPIVEYSSNNSGGSWWLKDADWYALEATGWEVDWVKDQKDMDGERWLGALASYARKNFDNPSDAIEEFENITGESASAVGCNCCGPPHSFSYEDEDGYHYASGVATTTIGFN
jgi:hypothetical protein